MATISEHHRPKCGVEGKCSRPMWQYGMPVFCDEPAWGEQYAIGSRHGPCYDPPGSGPYGRYQPYCSGLACKAHGGPGPTDIRFVRDGNMWCAFRHDFENLAESLAGFGETQDKAEADLVRAEQAASDAKEYGPDDANECPECGGVGEDCYRRECRICEGHGRISGELLAEWQDDNGQFGVGA